MYIYVQYTTQITIIYILTPKNSKKPNIMPRQFTREANKQMK